MLDIVNIQDGQDIEVVDRISAKAGNVLRIQLGSLEYAPNFGVDYQFFLESPFQVPNESFKAYLIQRLTEHQINVADVTQVLEGLFAVMTVKVGDANPVAKGLVL